MYILISYIALFVENDSMYCNKVASANHSSTVYKDHKGLGFLAKIFYHKSNLILTLCTYFVTPKLNRLDIAKAFRSTINLSIELL